MNSPENYPICWYVENTKKPHYEYLIWNKSNNIIYHFSKDENDFVQVEDVKIPEDALQINSLSMKGLTFRINSKVMDIVSDLITKYRDIKFDDENAWILISK